ncbi:MAG: leucine-rich repeat domain-containing protein [Roseburia sp.]|nr:leucine-rich repeat domain-containing protein [Roseburia sp.]
MKKKAVLSLLALVCAVICAFGFSACHNTQNDDDDNIDGTKGLEYELSADESSYSVSLPNDGNWENADIIIPAAYRQKPVTVIKDHGFEDSKIKSVIIPDSVKTVGTQAFAYCDNLKTVTFGNGVTDIGKFAFRSTALETVTLPDSVKTIGNNAFGNNGSLKSVTVNANAVFDDFVFDNCPILEKAEFLGEDSLTLGAQTFSKSPSLKELTIAAKSATFVYNTFTECKPTKFAATFETICKADFAYTLHAEPPKELVFLQTETFANPNAVSDYSHTVTSVTLPATLKACEQNAFYSFNKLKTVIYSGTVGDWCDIDFSNGSANPLAKGAQLIIGGETIEGKLTVPSSVTKIMPYAFYKYKIITELELSDGVTEIGDYAFYETALRTAELPDGLETIRAHAFQSSPLYRINMPESLTTIEAHAFAECRLVLVTLPQSLDSLGINAFKDNHMLTRLIMTQEQIDNGMTPDYTDRLSSYFRTLTAESHESTVEKVGNFVFWKDENDNYMLMDYLGNEDEITLPAAVNGNKYAIHAFAFEVSELDKITFEDTSNWQSKYGYNAPNDMDVSDPTTNASNLQETFVNREWYQKEN